MDGLADDTNGAREQNSFGIKKIVDCKLENGRQMYKVKWEPTWEPAENLAGCEHVIDKFWSFVNKVKLNEEVAMQHRKRMRLEVDAYNVPGIDQNFSRMSQDSKEDVQRLIARTSETLAGKQSLLSPSDMLSTQQYDQLGNLAGMTLTSNKSNIGPAQQGNFGTPGNKNDTAATAKVESNESLDVKSGSSNSKSSLNNASLKYLENFNNPYVKIVIVCKICNKEQPSKFAGNWRQHYMTHSDKKPHKCPHCPKTFIRADQMRKHVQMKHSDANNFVAPTQEPRMMSIPNMKTENYY